LQFEKEAEAGLGLPPGAHSSALLPIGYPEAGSGQSAAVALPDVSMKIGGGSPPAISSDPKAPGSLLSPDQNLTAVVVIIGGFLRIP
jgi:hypothetical protein